MGMCAAQIETMPLSRLHHIDEQLERPKSVSRSILGDRSMSSKWYVYCRCSQTVDRASDQLLQSGIYER